LLLRFTLIFDREEHFRRSPECAFFTLINEHRQITPKKETKSRKPRASKASRLSTQSALTVASEAPSLYDTTAENEDSIVTTATNTIATSQRGRKMVKGKKAGMGRKTRAKKDEPTEVSVTEDMEAECDGSEAKVEKPKSTRGKKRTSEAIDESSSMISNQQQPAKRRTTRATRASVAVGDDAHIPTSVENNVDVDVEMNASDIAPEKKSNTLKKGRGSATKSKRNFSSTSTISKTSRMQIPDDDEIERALQADLERPLTDEEDDTLARRPKQPVAMASLAPVRKTTRARKSSNGIHVMFGVGEVKMDEAAIEAELEAMEAEESVPLPKSKGVKRKQGRKPSAKQKAAAARRVADVAQIDTEVKRKADPMDSQDDQAVHSPQESMIEYSSGYANAKIPPTRGTRASAMSVNNSNASLLSVDQPSVDIHLDSGNESDTSIASQATIVKTSQKRRGSALKSTKAGKKVVPKHIEEIVSKPTDTIPNEQAPVEKTLKKRAGRPKKVIHAEQDVVIRGISNDPTLSQQPSVEVTVEEPTKAESTNSKERGRAILQPQIASGAGLARQTTPASPKGLAASLSPQSSDAENHPPSSRPSTTKPLTQSQNVRIPLLISTPITSPSRRNVVAGLQTKLPWTAVDLDEIFLKSPLDKENMNQETAGLLAGALGKAKEWNLTSPERKMTVEEWIMFNARLAEEKLRGECERVVGVFEDEGGRAMRVLEGVECLD
jgi:hypothetical protein